LPASAWANASRSPPPAASSLPHSFNTTRYSR
jgi:hypothetical protein